MTLRVGTPSSTPGELWLGNTGFGVLGSVILATTATGDGGRAGYLYNDVDSGDEAKEFCGPIVTPPSAGTFTPHDDGSFDFSGAPDGSYSFAYQLEVDGDAVGSPVAVSITIGATSVTSDAYAAYLIRNAASTDLSPAFNVRGAVPIDLSPAFNVRGLTQSDASPIYAVRGAASADITPTYSIMSAGSVVSDLSPNFAVRGIAQGDLASAYNLCGQTQQDLTQNYALRGASATDLSASYEVAGAANAVQQDLTVSYSVFGVAVACPTAADIAAAVRVELTAELARIDATISSRSTVAAIMGYTAP